MIEIFYLALRDQLNDMDNAVHGSKETDLVRVVLSGESSCRMTSNRQLAVQEIADGEYEILIAEGRRKDATLEIHGAMINPKWEPEISSQGDVISLKLGHDLTLLFTGDSAVQFIQQASNLISGLLTFHPVTSSIAEELQLRKDKEGM